MRIFIPNYFIFLKHTKHTIGTFIMTHQLLLYFNPLKVYLEGFIETDTKVTLTRELQQRERAQIDQPNLKHCHS
jgi:hypothetical protein